MEIDDDKKRLTEWMDTTLTAMAASLPLGEKSCPHCGLRIRYPIIVRQTDIDLFAGMMRVAHRVMDEYGITANLLAEIRTRCLIEGARRKSIEE